MTSATPRARSRRCAIGCETVAGKNGGRLFNTAGDGFMLEFGSAGSAFSAIQEILDKRGKGEPPIRVGAHVGDVVVTATDDLLGHGVNVAARLQELAAPGTALVSAEFRSMARSSPTAAFQSRGQKPLENIEQRVQTFEILSSRQRFARASRKVGALTVAAAILARRCIFQPGRLAAAAGRSAGAAAGDARSRPQPAGRRTARSRHANLHGRAHVQRLQPVSGNGGAGGRSVRDGLARRAKPGAAAMKGRSAKCRSSRSPSAATKSPSRSGTPASPAAAATAIRRPTAAGAAARAR